MTAVYLGSAAGRRPRPDLCIAPCNGCAHMRVRCRWKGGGGTVRGEGGWLYLNRVCIQARVKLLFTEGSVSPTVKQRRNISSAASLPPPSISQREGSLSSMGFFMIAAACHVCVWSSQSPTCSGSQTNRNAAAVHPHAPPMYTITHTKKKSFKKRGGQKESGTHGRPANLSAGDPKVKAPGKQLSSARSGKLTKLMPTLEWCRANFLRTPL